MAENADTIGHGTEDSPHGPEDLHGIGPQASLRVVKQSTALAVDDLHHQSFVHHFECHALAKPFERLVEVDLCLDGTLHAFQRSHLAQPGQFSEFWILQLLLGIDPGLFILAHQRHIQALVGNVEWTPLQVEHIGRTAVTHGAEAGRVREVTGDGHLLEGGGGFDQPEHQEEGHQGQREVGERNLPRAAMVAAFDFFHTLDDDVLFGLFHVLALWVR